MWKYIQYSAFKFPFFKKINKILFIEVNGGKEL